MKITSAEFIISAVGPQQYPKDRLPEIALVGRSNVGKSSLINKMLSRKAIARTSSRPGKTQTLNYFKVNNQMYFVDFPGYGYAKVSKSIKSTWGSMIDAYLSQREELKFVVQLVDIRHAPSKDDVSMYEYCKELGIPTIVVATKGDKISRGRWLQHLKVIRQTLNFQSTDALIVFSTEMGQGRDELWGEILRRLKGKQESPEESAHILEGNE
ncbi:ribosome biogenesis GTP-binding protein YihA/YsxC [Brevibacillus laterosporus]|uniref:ribosome biogenesis GTP-binding protein YihA/YsxC n=1 Tax=Brevibacillus laterosporus TaxID=1465 RepID=UPI00264FDE5E|nr:ribosome biogenesis GTP-binding protein YihA/YsxC [Brevibacillus laterosporus]MDN9008731.1 ribosome biogenesis GTP-binding protein YihA/YsxC [Brevibacillus laterosporus]MDO0939817.1 ribosome biogenesis GTP-binding protein YihA/YsxC [Brevibacillus laterosporus]